MSDKISASDILGAARPVVAAAANAVAKDLQGARDLPPAIFSFKGAYNPVEDYTVLGGKISEYLGEKITFLKPDEVKRFEAFFSVTLDVIQRAGDVEKDSTEAKKLETLYSTLDHMVKEFSQVESTPDEQDVK